MNSVYLFLRLTLLAFYPEGTKVSFNENNIIFRLPGWSQGVLRWTFSESRKDILQIKEHIDNALFIFKNKNIKFVDTVLICIHKAIVRLKLRYIHTNEIKEFLNVIDHQITQFIDSRGQVDEPTIVCQNSRITQILGKWTFADIQFINLNLKCILELEKHEKNYYKNTLINNYIETIDAYTTHVNQRV